jgi:hypothetical protein
MIHPLEKPVYFDTSGGQPRAAAPVALHQRE